MNCLLRASTFPKSTPYYPIPQICAESRKRTADYPDSHIPHNDDKTRIPPKAIDAPESFCTSQPCTIAGEQTIAEKHPPQRNAGDRLKAAGQSRINQGRKLTLQTQIHQTPCSTCLQVVAGRSPYTKTQSAGGSVEIERWQYSSKCICVCVHDGHLMDDGLTRRGLLLV